VVSRSHTPLKTIHAHLTTYKYPTCSVRLSIPEGKSTRFFFFHFPDCNPNPPEGFVAVGPLHRSAGSLFPGSGAVNTLGIPDL
jgi:hypothetical protein